MRYILDPLVLYKTKEMDQKKRKNNDAIINAKNEKNIK